MTPLLVVAGCFLAIICGNIKPMVGEHLSTRNISETSSNKCVDCCNGVDSQSMILNRIVAQQDREMQTLEEITAKVVDDIPSELEKISIGLDVLKTTATGVNSSEINEQTPSLKEIEALLNTSLGRIQTLTRNLELLEGRFSILEHQIRDSLIGPKDCSDIRAMGHNTSGVYRVYPGSLAKRVQADVYCDMITPGGDWLIFQRRKDGSLNFERTWSEYAVGFGKDANGEFWLGNELLYLLTSNGNYKLHIDMEDFDGQERYAEYSTFSVGSSADNYRLTVSGYTGDAGDSFSGHSGMQFSTKDADNDIYTEGSCSLLYHGAWWYNACQGSNLNGLYLGGTHTSFADGIEWNTFRGYYYSLKTTEMKITAVYSDALPTTVFIE